MEYVNLRNYDPRNGSIKQHLKTVKMQTIDPKRCPNFIFIGEHYRPDGSCKCDDPNEKVMHEGGYKWSRRQKRWI